MYNARGVAVATIRHSDHNGWFTEFANGREVYNGTRNAGHWSAARLWTDELAAMTPQENVG